MTDALRQKMCMCGQERSNILIFSRLDMMLQSRPLVSATAGGAILQGVPTSLSPKPCLEILILCLLTCYEVPLISSDV